MLVAFPETPADRLLRLPEVLAIVRVSHSTFYAMIGRSEFPRGVRVGRRCVRWRESDVLAWVATRQTASGEDWI